LAIVTAGPEHQRLATGAWLTQNGALYHQLLMGPWQDVPNDGETIGQ
jgi:hypothetical protein